MIIQEVNQKADEFLENEYPLQTHFDYKDALNIYLSGFAAAQPEWKWEAGYEAGYSAAQLDGTMKLKESLKGGLVMILDEDGDLVIVHRKDLDE